MAEQLGSQGVAKSCAGHCWALLNECGMQTYLATRLELRLNRLLSDISNGNNDTRSNQDASQAGLDACGGNQH